MPLVFTIFFLLYFSINSFFTYIYDIWWLYSYTARFDIRSLCALCAQQWLYLSKPTKTTQKWDCHTSREELSAFSGHFVVDLFFNWFLSCSYLSSSSYSFSLLFKVYSFYGRWCNPQLTISFSSHLHDTLGPFWKVYATVTTRSFFHLPKILFVCHPYIHIYLFAIFCEPP